MDSEESCMQLRLEKGSLYIDLGFWQSILALRRSVNVPLTHVEDVTAEAPRLEWRELRAPGSFVPGLVKAAPTDVGAERRTSGSPRLARASSSSTARRGRTVESC